MMQRARVSKKSMVSRVQFVLLQRPSNAWVDGWDSIWENFICNSNARFPEGGQAYNHMLSSVWWEFLYLFTSVEDKNSTEAIRMWGLFCNSLPRSLGSTCAYDSYNWAAHTVGREAGHREVFQQIKSQLSDLPRFQAVPRCRACRIPPWTAGRWSSREQPTSKWSLQTGSNREWLFKSWEVSTLSVYQAAWVRRWPTSAKICRIP